MKKILVYFLINIIGLILIIIGCLGILWKLWENYGLLFIVIFLSVIYILIWRDRRFDANFFNNSDMSEIQRKLKPYNRIILLFYWVLHGLLYIYIIEMPMIIQDIYLLSIIMQGLFIWHVLILNWLYMIAEKYNKGKMKFIISRISVLTSWVWVALLMKQILMIIEMIGYYYEVLEEKKKKSYKIKKIWKFLNQLICEIFLFFSFNIWYISSVFNEYSKLLIGYKLNIPRITLIYKIQFYIDDFENHQYKYNYFENSYYYLIICLLILLYIIIEPRLYMIYFILILVNYYYAEIKYRIIFYFKEIENYSYAFNLINLSPYINYVRQDHIFLNSLYSPNLYLDYIIFFYNIDKWFGFFDSIIQSFNIFDVCRFFIYDPNWRNKMVIQSYGTIYKWEAFEYYVKKASDKNIFINLINNLIIKFKLNISIDEFLRLAYWYLDEHDNYIIVRYPVEFVNIENITLWKYLTKEEGYYELRAIDEKGINEWQEYIPIKEFIH